MLFPQVMSKSYSSVKFWSSRSQMFFRISVHKNFAKFTEIHLSWSLFLIKRDSNTSVFLWILRNFSEHLFYRSTTVAVRVDFFFAGLFPLTLIFVLKKKQYLNFCLNFQECVFFKAGDLSPWQLVFRKRKGGSRAAATSKMERFVIIVSASETWNIVSSIETRRFGDF